MECHLLLAEDSLTLYFLLSWLICDTENLFIYYFNSRTAMKIHKPGLCFTEKEGKEEGREEEFPIK